MKGGSEDKEILKNNVRKMALKKGEYNFYDYFYAQQSEYKSHDNDNEEHQQIHDKKLLNRIIKITFSK